MSKRIPTDLESPSRREALIRLAAIPAALAVPGINWAAQ